MPTLRDAVIALAEAKHREAQARAKRLAAEKTLVDAMKATGESKVEVEFETGDVLKGTLVTSQRMRIDEVGLRERLTDEQWESVTERSLNTELLEAEVAADNISAKAVLECTTWSDNKPFVRITGAPPSLAPEAVTEPEALSEAEARDKILRKPAMRSRAVRQAKKTKES